MEQLISSRLLSSSLLNSRTSLLSSRSIMGAASTHPDRIHSLATTREVLEVLVRPIIIREDRLLKLDRFLLKATNLTMQVG